MLLLIPLSFVLFLFLCPFCWILPDFDVHVIYQKRGRVFHQDFQIPRGGLEK